MNKLLAIFQREDGEWSLARIMVFINWVNWLILTDVGFFTNKTWAGYEVYTGATWVGFFALIANKTVECKYLKVGNNVSG